MPHAMRWQHAKIGLGVDYDHYRPKGENKTGEGGEKRQNFEENREDAKWRFMLLLPVTEILIIEAIFSVVTFFGDYTSNEGPNSKGAWLQYKHTVDQPHWSYNQLHKAEEKKPHLMEQKVLIFPA